MNTADPNGVQQLGDNSVEYTLKRDAYSNREYNSFLVGGQQTCAKLPCPIMPS